MWKWVQLICYSIDVTTNKKVLKKEAGIYGTISKLIKEHIFENLLVINVLDHFDGLQSVKRLFLKLFLFYFNWFKSKVKKSFLFMAKSNIYVELMICHNILNEKYICEIY